MRSRGAMRLSHKQVTCDCAFSTVPGTCQALTTRKPWAHESQNWSPAAVTFLTPNPGHSKCPRKSCGMEHQLLSLKDVSSLSSEPWLCVRPSCLLTEWLQQLLHHVFCLLPVSQSPSSHSLQLADTILILFWKSSDSFQGEAWTSY